MPSTKPKTRPTAISVEQYIKEQKQKREEERKQSLRRINSLQQKMESIATSPR